MILLGNNYHLFGEPIKFPVTLPAIRRHEIHEEFSEVVVVRSFKEVESPHVIQVLWQLLWRNMGYILIILIVPIPVDISVCNHNPKSAWKITWKVFTENFNWGGSLRVPDLLVPFLEGVGLETLPRQTPS